MVKTNLTNFASARAQQQVYKKIPNLSYGREILYLRLSYI